MMRVMPLVFLSTMTRASSDMNEVQQKDTKPLLLGFLEDKVHYCLIHKFLGYEGMSPLCKAFEQVDKLRTANESIPECSKFAVRLRTQGQTGSEDHDLRLEDYLRSSLNDVSIENVDSLASLVKEHPEKFIKLVLKATPKSRSELESKMATFVKKTMKMDELIDDLTVYDSTHETLASLILDYFILDSICFQVRTQLWYQIGMDVWYEAGSEHWYQIRDFVSERAGLHMWNEMRDHIVDEIGMDHWFKLAHLVRDPIKDLIRSFINAPFRSNFQLPEEIACEDFFEIVQPTVDYTLIVYHLSSIAMRHAQSYKDLFKTKDDGLMKFLKTEISEVQAKTILEKMTLPEAQSIAMDIPFLILKNNLAGVH